MSRRVGKKVQPGASEEDTSGTNANQQQGEINALVEAMMSADGETCKAGEETFNAMMNDRTDFLVTGLLKVANVGSPNDVNRHALMILRKVLLRGEAFGKISSNVMKSVGKDLLSLMETTDDKPLRIAASETIAAAANTGFYMEPPQTWDDLWPVMFDSVASASADAGLRAAALHVLAEVAEVCAGEYFDDNDTMSSLALGIASCMSVSESDLQCEAFVTSAVYFGMMPAEAAAKLIPPMMTVLGQALQQGNYDNAEKMLHQFRLVLMNQPKLVRPFLQNILEAMMQVASSANVRANVRHAAVQCMLSCCEVDAKAVKKIRGFIPNFFNLMFRYTLKQEVVDDWETIYVDMYGDDATDTKCGCSALGELASAVGGKELKQLVVSTATQGIKDTQWQSVCASLSMLLLVAAGCHDVLLDDIDNIFAMVAPLLENDNTRIRCHATVICRFMLDFYEPMTKEYIHDFMVDFYEPMTKKYIHDVLPLMIKRVNDSVPFIQCNATNFFIKLLEDEPAKGQKSPIAPVWREIITAMTQALKTTKHAPVREKVLRGLRGVIENLETLMTPFVADLVGLFREILGEPEPSSTDPAVQRKYQEILGRSVECFTWLATAVGKEAFAPYTKDLCEYLGGLMPKLSVDDARFEYMVNGSMRMVKIMDDGDTSLVRAVIPTLLITGGCTVNVENVPDEGQDENGSGYTCNRVIIPNLGKRVIRFKTALADGKCLSLTSLSELLTEKMVTMKEYTEALTTVADSGIECHASQYVRMKASELYPLIGQLIKAAKPDQMKDFTNHAFEKLLSHIIRTGVKCAAAACPVLNLGKVIELADANTIADEQVEAGMREFVVTSQLLPRQMLRAMYRDSSSSDDDEDDEDVDVEALGDLLQKILGVVHTILKKYDSVVPFFQLQFQALAHELLYVYDSFPRLGLSLLCTFAEYGKLAAVTKRDFILKYSVDSIDNSKEPEVLNDAFHIIGVLANTIRDFAPAELEGFVRVSAPSVIRLLSNSNFSSDVTFMAARANAVSTLMKLLEVNDFAPQLVKVAIPLIVGHLPCGEDAIEARVVHRKILEWLTTKKLEWLTPKRSTLVRMFKKLLKDDQKACDDGDEQDVAVLDEESREMIRKL